MKLWHIVLIFIIGIIWIAQLKITLKPFHITITKPWEMLGCIFLVISIICYQYGSYKKGEKDMLEKVIKMIDEIKSKKQ